MKQGIYEVEIYHARTRPAAQKFTIRGYTLLVDLDSLNAAGSFRMGMHRLARRDFSLLADTQLNPSAAALKFLQEKTGIKADQVFLLANPRIAGYVFNPVSFFFCLSRSTHVATIVEVNNTFGEQKHYVVPAGGAIEQQQKNFYVSPFISAFADFRMRLNFPADLLDIGIHTVSANGTELIAEMRGRRYELTAFNLLRFFVKYPFHTVRVIVLIHWYALRLLLRKVPFYPKAAADAAIIHTELRGRL